MYSRVNLSCALNTPALTWNRQQTPEALHTALETLSHAFPIAETSGPGSLEFIFNKGSSSLNCQVVSSGGYRIEYGLLASALRGLGHALAGQTANERASFQTFGIMLDCSRNAVMTVPYVKRWLRQLALLGYNRLMLYTEDTYRLPEEPFFGFMRGGYSAAEIREVDAYAAKLNIEVVACIQTLGHLHQILKWSHYKEISDTPGVILVGEEKTYALIEKMIGFWRDNLRSRHIHIGMDEAHDMGRGKFLDKNGWQPPFETFTAHLNRVTAICEDQGLKPMIWSDMFFRMGNPQMSYYDPETVIPDAVASQIPAAVDLVYWDYYSKDQAFYEDWIQRHRALGREPMMASGIWTWARFWYDHTITKAAVEPCMQACQKAGLQNFLFTMWGDGGAYCEFDSAFAGLAWGADLAYGGTGTDERVAPLVRSVCESDYALLLKGTRLHVQLENGLDQVVPPTILWDDPLLGIGWQCYPAEVWTKVAEEIDRLKSDFLHISPQTGPVDWGYIQDLLEVLSAKLAFQQALTTAYSSAKKSELRRLATEEIPRIQQCIEKLALSFRRQWLRRNKPFGMEVIQVRFGAMNARCDEAARRITEYVDGHISCIEEIEAREQNLSCDPVKYFYWLMTGSAVI